MNHAQKLKRTINGKKIRIEILEINKFELT